MESEGASMCVCEREREKKREKQKTDRKTEKYIFQMCACAREIDDGKSTKKKIMSGRKKERKKVRTDRK